MGWFLLGAYLGWTYRGQTLAAAPGAASPLGVSPLASLTSALPTSITNLLPGANSPSTSALVPGK